MFRTNSLRMPEQDIALALSGIEFDSLAFSPELEKICRDIKISNSRCEFVGVSNVYGVNDSSIQKVIIRGDPTNLGRESVCQAAGRTARSFDGRNQIGIMAISEAVLKVFADTTSIMDHFSKNINYVKRKAVVKIQAIARGYIRRRFLMDIRHFAAMHIQRLTRTYLARRRILINRSVILIQTVARGYIARVTTARIKNRKERRTRQRSLDSRYLRYAERREAERQRRASAVSPSRDVEDGEGSAQGDFLPTAEPVFAHKVTEGTGGWTHVGRPPREPVVEPRGPHRLTGVMERWIPGKKHQRAYGFISISGRPNNLYVQPRNIRDMDFRSLARRICVFHYSH